MNNQPVLFQVDFSQLICSGSSYTADFAQGNLWKKGKSIVISPLFSPFKGKKGKKGIFPLFPQITRATPVDFEDFPPKSLADSLHAGTVALLVQFSTTFPFPEQIVADNPDKTDIFGFACD